MARQRPPVQVLIKPASADCNLACRYCFYLEKSALYPDSATHRMSPEVQEEMIRQIIAYGGAQPAFPYQGGEPTLMGLGYFQRAVELQKRHARPGQTICNSLQTNGLLIDDAWAAFLAEYRFLIGLSIDGPADLHDANRVDRGGGGSHARALRAAGLFSEYGVEFNILSVVSKASEGRGREVYRYFRDQGWDFMQFIPAVEFDPATGRLADFCISPDAYGQFMCDVFDEWKADFRDGRPTTSVRLFDTILGMVCGASPPSCTFRRQCGIYLVIEHNGDCYSCDFFVEKEWFLGNLMKQSLPAMLDSKRQREFGRLKTQTPLECRICRWRHLCNGGCTKDRLRSTVPGQMGLDYFCGAHQKIFEYTHDTMLALRDLVRSQ